MYIKYTNNGIFEGFILFSDSILWDNKLPKTLIPELISGFQTLTEFVILTCAVLSKEKRNSFLDLPT